MNAMKKKMPDKLFGWTGVLGSLYASPRKPEEVNSEEYIRKDALLEWAREKEERLGKMFDVVPSMVLGAKLDACKEFIEKIKEL